MLTAAIVLLSFLVAGVYGGCTTPYSDCGKKFHNNPELYCLCMVKMLFKVSRISLVQASIEKDAAIYGNICEMIAPFVKCSWRL